MAHVWDHTNPEKTKLFYSISWRDGLRKEEDQRDFETVFDSCVDPAKDKDSYIKPTNHSIRKEYAVCPNRKKVPYGMYNPAEDFATFAGSYFNDGKRLRRKIKKQLALSINNLEPLLKYLFVKYLTPFKGREYSEGKAIGRYRRGITLAYVERRLRRRLRNHPQNEKVKWALGIIDRIKNMARKNP
jgi:hypothetical protein